MDNAQKAIMVGVGLFITIIIISAVMLISSAGQDLIDESMNELGNLSDSLSRQLYSDYAGGTFSGSQVIASVKKYAGSDVTVGIGTYNSSTGKVTFTKPSAAGFTTSNVGSVSNYVVSSGKYKSYVELDSLGEKVVKIVFVKQYSY